MLCENSLRIAKPIHSIALNEIISFHYRHKVIIIHAPEQKEGKEKKPSLMAWESEIRMKSSILRYDTDTLTSTGNIWNR
jgi:hypothetical protein